MPSVRAGVGRQWWPAEVVSEGEADARRVMKVGVSFSSKTGTIEEWEMDP